MSKKSHLWSIWVVIFVLLGIIFAGMGFYKMLMYENSDYTWGTHTNAYVGGDAYNYIINGTYFAGYSALSGAMFVCACICGVQDRKEESIYELYRTLKEVEHTLKGANIETLSKEREGHIGSQMVEQKNNL